MSVPERAQGDGRAAWREFVGSPAMCAAESGAFGRLSPWAGHRRRRSGLDAADRRIASEVAVLRLAANGVRAQPGRPRHQPQARAKADARDGDRGAGSAPRHQQSRARPQDLSLSAARREHHRAQSCLGQRHHLYSDGAWLSVSGGDHRLGQPGGSGLALVEHDGSGFCIAALDEALARHGTPKIFNTDQGAQFTSAPSPAGSRLQASRFRWTAAVVSWTTFSSSDCGARSNTRKCI